MIELAEEYEDYSGQEYNQGIQEAMWGDEDLELSRLDR